MPKYSAMVSDYMAAQHLAYFREPHTVSEAAEHFRAHYKTMSRYVKSYADGGHLLMVYRKGNEKVFQVGSETSVPVVSISGKLWPIDQFLSVGIPNVAQQKKYESKVARKALYYRSWMVSMYATAVAQARLENGDPGSYLHKLRQWLVEYVAILQEQMDEIKKMLDHPTLWDVDTLIEWANNNEPLTGVDQSMIAMLNKHFDALLTGPETEAR